MAGRPGELCQGPGRGTMATVYSRACGLAICSEQSRVGGRPLRGWSGFLQEKRHDPRENDAVEEQCESSLIVRQAHWVLAGSLHQPRSEHRPEQRAEGKIDD